MFGPLLCAVVILPGTAQTTRPKDRAHDAVRSAPERVPASTTTVIADTAAISRFLAGNIQRRRSEPGGSSEVTAPVEVIRRWSSRREGGYGRSAPAAKTATVAPPTST